ncbi:MAG: exopolyphosphatase [Hyphomicrobiaceae bacterium]
MRDIEEDWTDQGRLGDLEPIGIVDIGSNSVRLVIYDGAVRAPTVLFNEKEQCGLGRSVATMGMLGDAGVRTALETLARFRAICRVLKVKNVQAIATAAVREAKDGSEFLAKAEAALGISIRLLSGEREAHLASLGIAMGFGGTPGVAGDLGGGSLELVEVEGEQQRSAVSLPLGGLRLIDVTGNRFERAEEIVGQQLDAVEWVEKCRGLPFFAVGGTWRALARFHMAHHNYPLRVLQGYSLPAREVIKFCDLIIKSRKRLPQLRGIEVVANSRREILPYGAMVLRRLLQRLQPTEMIVSVFGIREGLLFDQLSPHERHRDPLICACEDFARLRSRSPRHAWELCSWTDQLFALPSLEETPDEKRLRYAACLLSDIGWRASPDFRGEQSLNVIAHAALSGIDHRGRLFLALTVYFRHAGAGEPLDNLSGRLKALAGIIQKDRRVVRRARILAAAIRAAHMLSMGQPGIIDETPLSRSGNRLVLTLSQQNAALNGPRLMRRFDSLAKLLDLEPEIRTVP